MINNALCKMVMGDKASERRPRNSTGFPEVGVTLLIAHISLMPGPIIKPFDSMKVKTG